MIQTLPFAIEYTSTTTDLTDALKERVEKRLAKLSRRHHDLTGASLAVDTLSGDTNVPMYRVRLVVYRRPENIAVVRKRPSVEAGVNDILDVMERQIRDRRARRRDSARRFH